jgi:hypothetical protein
LQQFDTIKPDRLMPITCSIVLFAIDFMHAEQDMKIVLTSLESTPVAAALLLSTQPPHSPDQSMKLMDQPLPWPLWQSWSMCCKTHGRAWLLPVPPHPPEAFTYVPSSATALAATLSFVTPWITQAGRMESKHEHYHLFWLLPLLAYRQADCLGRAQGLCSSETAPSSISTCWGYTKWVYQQRSPKPASQGDPSGWYGGLPTGRPSCWKNHGGTGHRSSWRIHRHAHGGLPCSTRIGLSLGLQVVSAPVPTCNPRQAPL